MRRVNDALSVASLKYEGSVQVRHFTEVLVNDITPEVISSKVKRPLNGLKVAPYYGCQLVRPDYGFDDPESPQSLDRLVKGVGAEAVPFPMKNRCCGGSLIISDESMALELIYRLLESARESEAECLITPCPLCQLNLDAYQGKVNSKFNADFDLPVLFVSQLIGLALEIEPKTLGLDSNIVSPNRVLDHITKISQEVGSGT
jgi:heterodisulfide reductase subunit B